MCNEMPKTEGKASERIKRNNPASKSEKKNRNVQIFDWSTEKDFFFPRGKEKLVTDSTPLCLTELQSKIQRTQVFPNNLTTSQSKTQKYLQENK